MHVSKYKRSKYTLFMIQAKNPNNNSLIRESRGCLTIGHFLILTSIFHINNFFICVNFKKNLCCEKKMGGPAGPAPPPLLRCYEPVISLFFMFLNYVYCIILLFFCCYLVIKKCYISLRVDIR